MSRASRAFDVSQVFELVRRPQQRVKLQSPEIETIEEEHGTQVNREKLEAMLAVLEWDLRLGGRSIEAPNIEARIKSVRKELGWLDDIEEE